LYCSKWCKKETLGDCVCNEDCNVEACEFDRGDCTFPNNCYCAPGCSYE
jgi:hypothetical protein